MYYARLRSKKPVRGGNFFMHSTFIRETHWHGTARLNTQFCNRIIASIAAM
jgi:hypothetical protein